MVDAKTKSVMNKTISEYYIDRSNNTICICIIKYYVTLNFIVVAYNMTEACIEILPMVIKIEDNTDITSPNYPRNYPNNLDCTWKIFGTNDPPRKIRLTIEDVAMDDE